MDYTVSQVKKKINQLSDKMGSDYFTLPQILNFFETATYDFVGERLKHVEKTQEITDDIRNLISSPVNLPAIEDPNISGRYIVAVPPNYLRQVAYDVYYEGNVRCRSSKIIRHAEYINALNNPNKRPSKDYPVILQFDSVWEIDAGGTQPLHLRLTYGKKPNFATTGEPNTRIVNLPDDAIEKIMKITVTNLFGTTADERQQPSYQLQEAYREIFQ